MEAEERRRTNADKTERERGQPGAEDRGAQKPHPGTGGEMSGLSPEPAAGEVGKVKKDFDAELLEQWPVTMGRMARLAFTPM